MTAESHHLVGHAVDSGLHGGAAGGEGLVDVGGGSEMGGAALQKGQLHPADLLDAQLLLDIADQRAGHAAQLLVAEAVGGSIGRAIFCDEHAVLVVDALGDHHHAVAPLIHDPLHVLKELIHIEVGLRQVDQIGPVARSRGYTGGAGQPSGVTAHDLHDDRGIIIVHVAIPAHLHAAGDHVLGGGGEAGAMVRAIQVVVDGLGHADDPTDVLFLLEEFADLIAGVHGVVAADIEEVADIVLLEHLHDPAIIRIVVHIVLQLIAAGTQGGRGRVEQEPKLVLILLIHIVQNVVQNAPDAVGGSVYVGDALVVQCGADHAVGAGVDDGGGTAGLSDQAGTNQFIHCMFSFFVYKSILTILLDFTAHCKPVCPYLLRNPSR